MIGPEPPEEQSFERRTEEPQGDSSLPVVSSFGKEADQAGYKGSEAEQGCSEPFDEFQGYTSPQKEGLSYITYSIKL